MNVVDINIRSLIALENADQGEALIGIKKRCYPKRMMRVFTTPIPKYRSLTVICPLPSRISENRSTYSLYKKNGKNAVCFQRVIIGIKWAVEMSCLAIKPVLLLGTLILEKKNRARKEKKRKEEEKEQQIRF